MEAGGAEEGREEQREEEEEDFVCLDESFFINRNYELTTFTFGSHVLELLCLQSASKWGLTRLLRRQFGRTKQENVIRSPCLIKLWERATSSRNCAFQQRATSLPGPIVDTRGTDSKAEKDRSSNGFVREDLMACSTDSTDYDLTGQLVWPGSVLLNNFLCKNMDILKGCSVIELGSGVGITGILCRRFCREVVLTDHNDEVLEILKKNIELQASSISLYTDGLMAEKLEWGNADHVSEILQKYPSGFDIILGADICFQHASIPLLFSTVEKLLSIHDGQCRFILAYVSRAKTMDEMVFKEAVKLGMRIREVPGTKAIISNLEGVIFEITLRRNTEHISKS